MQEILNNLKGSPGSHGFTTAIEGLQNLRKFWIFENETEVFNEFMNHNVHPIYEDSASFHAMAEKYGLG